MPPPHPNIEEVVVLHIYDLSMGAARSMSMMLLGRQIDLIPHTGIVYHDREYFFGGGIKALPPNEVTEIFGLQPVERLILGRSLKTEEELHVFLRHISPRFTMDSYNLFSNNCNHFSSTLSSFLIGAPIPSRITDIPRLVLSTPLGSLLGQTMSGMNNRFGAMSGGDPFSALAESRGVSRHEMSSSMTAIIPRGEPALSTFPTTVTSVTSLSSLTGTPLLSISIMELNEAFFRLDQLFTEAGRLIEFESLKQFIRSGNESGMLSESIFSTLANSLHNERYCVAALYVLRVLVLNESCVNLMINNGCVDFILTTLISPMEGVFRSSQATVLSLVFISNSLAHNFLPLSKEMINKVVRILSSHLSNTSSSVRTAAAILALNSVNHLMVYSDPINHSELFSSLLVDKGLVTETDEKALWYRLVAAGRLVLRSGNEIQSEHLIIFHQSLDEISKRTHISDEIKRLILDVMNVTNNVTNQRWVKLEES